MQILSAIWDFLYLLAAFFRWYQGLSTEAKAQFIRESHEVFQGVKTAKTKEERYARAAEIQSLINRS